MTQPQPLLSAIPLWERHAELVIAILRDALALLAQQPITGSEIDMNRTLDQCLLRAVRARRDRGEPTLDTPFMNEARNQPSPDTLGATAEHKIPDFQCGFVDHYCDDPLLSRRMFVIECKRLGRPTAAGWEFNRRYVDDGVNRFVDTAWRYGNNVPSGAMVGYVDDSPMAGVVVEVNDAASARGFPPLQPQTPSGAPLELSHVLERGFPDTPFRLAHLWIQSADPPAPPTPVPHVRRGRAATALPPPRSRRSQRD